MGSTNDSEAGCMCFPNLCVSLRTKFHTGRTAFMQPDNSVWWIMVHATGCACDLSRCGKDWHSPRILVVTCHTNYYLLVVPGQEALWSISAFTYLLQFLVVLLFSLRIFGDSRSAFAACADQCTVCARNFPQICLLRARISSCASARHCQIILKPENCMYGLQFADTWTFALQKSALINAMLCHPNLAVSIDLIGSLASGCWRHSGS